MILVSNLCGKISPLSIKEYRENEGFFALEKALFKLKPEQIIDEIKSSNLKGRGGAAFPTGLKMHFVSSEQNETKYVICNADEGEPGTFKDKILLDGCPYQVLEGMIISAYAVGATYGYIYIRGEYPKTRLLLLKAIESLKNIGYLGKNIMGTKFSFDIEVRSGAGAYVCGEETALIESIEGNPGRSRFKPPYTANRGLWQKPTLVNNVETLINIPYIIKNGSDNFKSFGTKSSSGTKLMSVSGCVENKGVYEIEFGMTINEVINEICGGPEKGKKIKFVQLGGSSGAVLPVDLLDTKLDFDELSKLGIGLGSGALFVGSDSICILDFIKSTMKFFEHESCGKCTPCREGNKHLVNIIERIIDGNGCNRDLELITNICELMQSTSLCGLGQAAPTAILTTMKYFMDEYTEHIQGYCRAGVCNFLKEEIVNG